MKIGKILSKGCMGLGYAGLAAYGIVNLGLLYESIKNKIEERRNRHYKNGYDKCYHEMKEEIEELRKENARLYEEALRRSEAAE